jgi:hypothetical protein
MKTQRWLLPFACAVDLQAIDAAVRVASHSGATLIALALVVPWQGPRREQHRTPRVRLEQIQESKDFLEAVRWKAMRRQVTVECYEMFTEDVAGSIATQLRHLDCQSIIVTRRGVEDALLSSHDLKHVLVRPPAPLLFLSLPETKQGALSAIPFFSSLQRLFRQYVREQVAAPDPWIKRSEERQRV